MFVVRLQTVSRPSSPTVLKALNPKPRHFANVPRPEPAQRLATVGKLTTSAVAVRSASKLQHAQSGSSPT